MKKFYALPILGAIAALTPLSPSGTAFAATDTETAMANPSDWASQAGDYANHRYSTLNQINAGNVAGMQVAWTMSTGVLRGHEGSPLVIGDMMYIHTPFPNNVYAVSLADQTYKWKYEPKQDGQVVPVMCCDTVNRGLAYGDGKIFLQQADTTLVALDAKSGKVVWTVKNGDSEDRRDQYQCAARVRQRGADRHLRRRVRRARPHERVRHQDGKEDLDRVQHRAGRSDAGGPREDDDLDRTASMAPIGKDSSLKTWKGDQWKLGGGTTWGWYAYDPKLNLVYYGSGNPGTWNPSQRPGDNKWSMTIMARDLNTGMAKWVFQMTPHDQWDFDGVNEMVLGDDPHEWRQDRAGRHGPPRSQRLRLHPQPRDRRTARGAEV